MKQFRASGQICGLLTLIALVGLASCANSIDSTQTVPQGFAKVDLRAVDTVVEDPVFTPRLSVSIPQTHKVGDKRFPYEGIGWENEIVGYRLYLDERAVTDIFGKTTPLPVLDIVDYRKNYHAMADWGMDILKVGPSLGVGGLGLYRGESLERFGPDADLSVQVLNNEGDSASFTLIHRDVPINQGVRADVETTYKIEAGSPLTWVTVSSSAPENVLASGLVNSGSNTLLESVETRGAWRYIATWGDSQSEAKDGLGTALFYRAADAQIMPTVNDTFPVRFTTANPNYAFAGVWEQGPMGIKDYDGFVAWLDAQLGKLNQ